VILSQDSDRYKKEMAAFNSRQENRLRGEASRSSGKSPHPASTQDHNGDSFPELATGTQILTADHGYAYGATNFNGYAMPMYNYAAYMADVPNHEAMLGPGFPSAQSGAFHQPYVPGMMAPGNPMMYT
jgi:hypothetical protein